MSIINTSVNPENITDVRNSQSGSEPLLLLKELNEKDGQLQLEYSCTASDFS